MYTPARLLALSFCLLAACNRPTPAQRPATPDRPPAMAAHDAATAPQPAPTPPAPAPPPNPPSDNRCRTRLAAMPPLPPGNPNRPCTERGCSSGFSIAVRPTTGWAPGAYTYEIELDDQRITCQGTLPLRPCGQPSVQCTSQDVTIGQSGCALPAAQQGFSGVEFDDDLCPDRVRVTLKRGGDTLFTQEFRPEYRRIEANGPGCGPVCLQSHAEVTIPRAATP